VKNTCKCVAWGTPTRAKPVHDKATTANTKTMYGITKPKYGIVKTYFAARITNIAFLILKFDIAEEYDGNLKP
jgi:hypothetical protein